MCGSPSIGRGGIGGETKEHGGKAAEEVTKEVGGVGEAHKGLGEEEGGAKIGRSS